MYFHEFSNDTANNKLLAGKLLENMSTRVPVEVKQIIDDIAVSNGSDRSKWIREAIDLKLKVDLGISSTEELMDKRNTLKTSEYLNVFRNIRAFLHALKKPDVAGRASRVH